MAADLDDVFAYTTPKMVLVRDRRLGLLYYGSIVAIAVYIIWTIVSDQLYLRKESISGGSTKFTLTEPQFSKTLSYCNGKCVFLSPERMNPSKQDSSVFLTSAIFVTPPEAPDSSCTPAPAPTTNKDLPQSSNCIAKFKSPTAEDFSNVADIEKYILNIEHSVKGLSNSRTYRNMDLKGTLLKASSSSNNLASLAGLPLENYSPMRVFVPSGASSEDIDLDAKDLPGGKNDVEVRPADVTADRITVKQILEAAGISSLDIKFGGTQSNKENSLRITGLSLIVYITYTNRISKPEELKYTYTVSVLEGIVGTSDSTELGNSTTDGLRLTKIYRRGIQIQFVQTGVVGKFHFISLLTNLVASLALLRVAFMIVEMLMLYALPQRKEYHSYKFEKTADFSDIRDRQQSIKPPAMVETARRSNEESN